MKRKLTYAEAINEALHQLMQKDKNVIVIGQGVTSPWYVGATTVGLLDKFGEKRIIDTPVSESAITGVAGGCSLTGARPILVHPRMDFMYYAFDQIINHMAGWHFMFGGKVNMPVVFWAIINRGGEQAAQHSQALQGLFMHIPGLKLVMPSTAYDAKGLLVSAVEDNSPVMYIDDRWLYSQKEHVPEDLYRVSIGKSQIRRKGKDLTIIASSYMTLKALEACEVLENEGIEAEVIDLRSIKPLDTETLCKSVKKTGRLVIADGGWRTCGLAAEISAQISEKVFNYLKKPIVRVTLPDAPAPASSALERAYYPTEKNIIKAAKSLCNKNSVRRKK
ncbi:MAG: alpha-ketoacid dehydrogenase subunit beta [Candidatus Omnitrophica bacterium]|nr:alpha-ketoacid dehydrogenase subunit beta [Candidatus Omnitrophota bacterium]